MAAIDTGSAEMHMAQGCRGTTGEYRAPGRAFHGITSYGRGSAGSGAQTEGERAWLGRAQLDCTPRQEQCRWERAEVVPAPH